VTVPGKTDMAGARENQKRYSISDAFKKFAWKIVPKIEQYVELKLLNNLYNKLPSEDLKDELLRAYKRRKYYIQSIGIEAELADNKAENVEAVKGTVFKSKFFDITLDHEANVGMPSFLVFC
jgi:hypothetical protein